MEAGIIIAIITGAAGVIIGLVNLLGARPVVKAQAESYVAEAYQKLATDMQEEIKKLQQSNRELENENITLTEKVNCLEDEVKRLDKENVELKSDNNFMKQQNVKFEQQIAELLRENELLREPK